jgi:cation diffusion facilitator family transporter
MIDKMDIQEQVEEKTRVAFSSVIAAIFLVLFKLAVGIVTNSLGIISEAIHSALDLGAAVITFFAVRVSDKPPDEKHHYGHTKIEGISALAEVVLLLVACVWIIYEAIHRLLYHNVIVEVKWYSFAVMVISILVNLFRSKALYGVAKKYDSQALEADALHFSSDVWSSIVVIAGLILVKIGFPLADPLAAIGVTILIVVASIKLGRKSIDMLLDRAPEELKEEIEKIVEGVAGVSKCTQLRVRKTGPKYFIDMVISLNKEISFEEVHRIASNVEQKIMQMLPGADVVVHTEPVEIKINLSEKGKRSDKEIVEQIIKEHFKDFVDYHKLSYDKKAKSFSKINFHLVIPKDVSLEEGHRLCDHLEKDIKDQLGKADIFIHLEPCDGNCEVCKKDCKTDLNRRR